jgi:hypothetical protein
MHPEYGLGDKVLYLNVPRKFVAGTVVFKETDRCADNITVTLKGEGVEQSYVTDAFGDFWFEGLESKSDYTVEIAQTGYEKISVNVCTSNDVNLGNLFLEKTTCQ